MFNRDNPSDYARMRARLGLDSPVQVGGGRFGDKAQSQSAGLSFLSGAAMSSANTGRLDAVPSVVQRNQQLVKRQDPMATSMLANSVDALQSADPNQVTNRGPNFQLAPGQVMASKHELAQRQQAQAQPKAQPSTAPGFGK